MRSEKILFPNSEGEQLAGRMELPDEEPHTYVIFAHCFTCTKDIASASRISMELARAGFGVLRFDFTGLGNSDGDFSNTNFTSNVQDLVKAYEFLTSTGRTPRMIIGHSLGGAAVLSAAGSLPEIKGVVTIAAPSDPAHVGHLFEGDHSEIEYKGEAEVNLAGRKFTIRKQFLDDIQSQSLMEKISKLGKSLLVLHSPVDQLVSIDHARTIYDSAKHPKSFISLDHADHLLMKKEDAIYAGQAIAAWATRYVCRDGVTEKASSASKAKEGEVIVEERDHKFYQYIHAGKHLLAADEPPSVGGTDKGPAPYDFLLAGLGACTAMTLRMYANHKKLPLEHVSIRLTHGKIHAKDCEDCETKVGKIDEIQREIEIRGELTDEQRERLLQIADKCPVHRSLESEIKVRTRMK